MLQRERKEAISRYYQPLSGHTSTGSYLAERVNVIYSSEYCVVAESNSPASTLSFGAGPFLPRAEICEETSGRLAVEAPEGPIY